MNFGLQDEQEISQIIINYWWMSVNSDLIGSIIFISPANYQMKLNAVDLSSLGFSVSLYFHI